MFPVGRIAVVADSTAYLPEDVLAKYGIRVVPLQVSVGARTGPEGLEFGADDVARILAERGAVVRTSRPPPEAFRTVYDELLAAGAEAAVVVTLSSRLSGTWDSALHAAQHTELDVRVVDSCSTAMGSGFAVLAAARAAADRRSVAEAERLAQQTAEGVRTMFCVESLEYLRRGGRIGRARALLGAALHVKPILHLDDGEIALLDKVRTSSRARARLVDLAVEYAGDREVDLAVQYLSTDGIPEAVVAALKERIPNVRDFVSAPLGPAIGAHVGPGVAGVVVSPVVT